jgi:hypothetical protein
LTVEATLENGPKAKCMEEEYTCGLKANNIKACITMISNKVMGHIDGKMAKGTSEIGRTIDVMAKGLSNMWMAAREQAPGKMIRE